MSILAKLSWRVIIGGNTLTGTILREKYGGWPGLYKPLPSSPVSATWRHLRKTVDLIRMGYVWRVGSGAHLSFLYDCWLLETRTSHSGKRQVSSGQGLLVVGGQLERFRAHETFASCYFDKYSLYSPSGIRAHSGYSSLASLLHRYFSTSSARKLLFVSSASTSPQLWKRI